MTPTHTPGPWTLKWTAAHENYSVMEDDEVVALVVHTTGVERRTNRARLLAAAPALLAALKDAERLIDGPVADHFTGDMMNDSGAYDVLNILRTAIAQAERTVQA